MPSVLGDSHQPGKAVMMSCDGRSSPPGGELHNSPPDFRLLVLRSSLLILQVGECWHPLLAQFAFCVVLFSVNNE